MQKKYVGHSIGNLTGWALLVINGVMFTTLITIFNSHPICPYYRVAIIFFLAGVVFSVLSLIFHKLGKVFMVLAMLATLVAAGCWVHDFLIQAKFIRARPMSAIAVIQSPADEQVQNTK